MLYSNESPSEGSYFSFSSVNTSCFCFLISSDTFKVHRVFPSNVVHFNLYVCGRFSESSNKVVNSNRSMKDTTLLDHV